MPNAILSENILAASELSGNEGSNTMATEPPEDVEQHPVTSEPPKDVEQNHVISEPSKLDENNVKPKDDEHHLPTSEPPKEVKQNLMVSEPPKLDESDVAPSEPIDDDHHLVASESLKEVEQNLKVSEPSNLDENNVASSETKDDQDLVASEPPKDVELDLKVSEPPELDENNVTHKDDEHHLVTPESPKDVEQKLVVSEPPELDESNVTPSEPKDDEHHLSTTDENPVVDEIIEDELLKIEATQISKEDQNNLVAPEQQKTDGITEDEEHKLATERISQKSVKSQALSTDRGSSLSFPELLENEQCDLQEQVLPEVQLFLEQMDSWEFNIFKFSCAVDNKPLAVMAKYLFQHYGFFKKFSIDLEVFDNFVTEIEASHIRQGNPYHNQLHEADILQTMHVILTNFEFKTHLTDLELFAFLVSAIILNYEHAGITNGFHVATRSERALTYNDRSVQENHTLSAFFFLLKKEKHNILSGLSFENYRKFRTLLIELVLASDMAFHFQLLKDIHLQISTLPPRIEKSKMLSFILHACSLSSSARTWEVSYRWTNMIMKEYFNQGDRERELNIPISPLCDRFETMIPDSEINYIDFIASPTFAIFGDLLNFYTDDCSSEPKPKPWARHLQVNKQKWIKIILNTHVPKVVSKLNHRASI